MFVPAFAARENRPPLLVYHLTAGGLAGWRTGAAAAAATARMTVNKYLLSRPYSHAVEPAKNKVYAATREAAAF